ncbi:hypothetical protein PoB_000441900 [Plakobranchus ocellatus]|uniref:Uncharacterized protein n=1 Tax=Plakobranchus ocellatus TaxID=259542 RepID=A0AAV3Y6M2_9GAST|nr:hypothetical protein PoB_000441900 [Plakobranchus ocellatus]
MRQRELQFLGRICRHKGLKHLQSLKRLEANAVEVDKQVLLKVSSHEQLLSIFCPRVLDKSGVSQYGTSLDDRRLQGLTTPEHIRPGLEGAIGTLLRASKGMKGAYTK